VLHVRDKICAVVAEPTASAMLRGLRQAQRESSTIELRLDYLATARERSRFLKRVKFNRRKFCVIATLRRRAAGGRFTGSIAAHRAALLAAAKAGCAWCDLEVESAERLTPLALQIMLLELRRAGARVMISFHDFRATPRDLRAVIRRLDRRGGDAIKIATQARSLNDSLRVLAATKHRRNVVAVPMGEVGLPARILALRHGSALSYASNSQKSATAPGQLSVHAMRRTYRADRLTNATRIYGVIGNPIAHSLSPLMHNAAFAARKVNAVFLPFLAKDLSDFLRFCRAQRLAGFAVTLPHKQAILRHLSGCDPLAARIGAVNTVVTRGNGALYGYNTDYVGVLRALERRVRLAGSRILILGAGGAARAATFALAEAGSMVCITACRASAGKPLAQAVNGEFIARHCVRGEFFDAIINATPVGMRRGDPSPLRARELTCRVVMDMIYKPAITPLLQLAKRRGIEIVTGEEMFLAQGMAQWEIWMGQRAPAEIMRRVVHAALSQEEGNRASSRR
jgi:3-dehydroquinate dehydratase/shikimate dehydrogenase